MLTNAQSVSAAGSAPAANQPGVGATPNGVPLVDIVTPNGAGLSHNKYDNFNVGTPGLILNNFNGEVGTSNLGGATPGNPNLRTSGPASVILNEVTSGNRSALNGPTEVFGGRADVIIANPNGITCSGCGFINTPRATLTTGVPDIGSDGRLTGFTVNGGDVTFEGTGGNFAAAPGSVDLFDVVSRQIHVNAPIYGKTIRLTGGASKYDYATGEATALTATSGTPEYAIDGTALGAMQADRIKVVVTEKGAGVKMSGDMAANAGELTLSADGKISIGNVSGRDGVTITSKQKATAAKVTSRQKVKVQADQGITLQSVAADSDIVLASGSGLLSISGDVNGGTTMQMSSGGGISAGSLTVGGGALLSASLGDIRIAGAAKTSGDLSLMATAGLIATGSLLSYGNITLNAGLDIAAVGNVFAGNGITVSGRSILTGTTVSGLDIAATQADPNGKVVFAKAADLRLTAPGDITAASLQSSGNISAQAATLSAGGITAHSAIDIKAVTNISGQLLAGSNVGIDAKGRLPINGNAIYAKTIAAGVDFAATDAAGGNIMLAQNGVLTLDAASGNIVVGNLLSSGNFGANAAHLQAENISSHGETTVSSGLDVSGQLLSAGDLTIVGDVIHANSLISGVDFVATKAAGGNIVLGLGGDMKLTATRDLVAGTMLAAGDLLVRGQTLAADTVTGHKDITLAGKTDIDGQILGAGNISISGTSIAADAIVSGVDIAATKAAGGKIVLAPSATGTGNLALAATGLLKAGTLLSSGKLNASGATVAAGNITSHGDTRLDGALNITGQILVAGNVLISGESVSSQLVAAGVDFDRTTVAGGKIVLSSRGDLTISAKGDIAISNMQAAGAISADGATLAADTVTGHQNISLSGAMSVTDQILGANDIRISGASIKADNIVSGVNFAATAAAGGNIVLTKSGNLLLSSTGALAASTLLSGGNLSANAATIAADNITAHGDLVLSADAGATNGSVAASGQILGAGNVLISGQRLAARTIAAGVDFAATNASNGDILLSPNGDLNISVGGDISVSTILAAGDLRSSARTITADAITGHKDITLSGVTKVNRQVLGASDVTISGSSINADAIVAGVDFGATKAAGGTITLASGANDGNLVLSAGSVLDVATLLSAGSIKASGGAIAADVVTSHGDLTLSADMASGRIDVSGQILAAGNLLISAEDLRAGTVAAGVDFHGTKAANGKVVLTQSGDLTVTAGGDVAAATLLAAGNIKVSGQTITSSAISGHRNINLDGSTNVTSQMLGAGAITISGADIRADAIITGVDFAATEAAGGKIILAPMAAGNGALSLSAANRLDVATLLSAGALSASATTIAAGAVTAHGDITLSGDTTVSGQILGAGNALISGQAITAETVAAGMDFDRTAASGGDILLSSNGDLTVTVNGAAKISKVLAAGSIDAKAGSISADSITSHKDITLSGATAVSGQILGAGDINLSGSGIKAGAVVSGVDFARTAASGGTITLAGGGELMLTSSGAINAGSLLSAASLKADGAEIKVGNVTAHGDVTLNGSSNPTIASGRVIVNGQILGAGKVLITGQSLSAQTIVAGIDFGTTDAANGDIQLSQSGDLTVKVRGEAKAAEILAAGVIDAEAALISAGRISGHDKIALLGATTVGGQVLGAGDVSISGPGIKAGAIVSGVDFRMTAANGAAIALGARGNLNLLSAADIEVGTLLSAGNLDGSGANITADTITAHGDLALRGVADATTAAGHVDVSGQILAASNVLISGQAVSAHTIVAGVDFQASVASGGDILLAPTGDLKVTAGGDVSVSTMQAAGDISVSGQTITAGNVTSHRDIKFAGSTNIGTQVLAARNIDISGGDIRAGAVVSGVDFAATAAANGGIILAGSGDLKLNAAGIVKAGTLLSAGRLDGAGQTVILDSVTAHGDIALDGATSINGQILSAGDVLISGQSLAAQAIVAGVDFSATEAAGGDIKLSSNGGLKVTLNGGSKSSTILAAGAVDISAAAIAADAITGHGTITLSTIPATTAASGRVDVSGQVLGAGDISISGSGVQAGAIVTGVDFARTAAASGNIIQTASGELRLNSTGDVSVGTLLAAADLTGKANAFRAASITSHGATDLQGSVDVTGQMLSGGALSVTGDSLKAGLLASGVDFAATDASGGNIVLGRSGSMSVKTTGHATAGAMLSGGDVTVNASNLEVDSLTSHGNVDILADLNASSRILSAGDLAVKGGSIEAPILISGVDFDQTNAAAGNIVLGASGAMTLIASGNVASTALLSASDFTARAASIKADSITSHGGIDIAGNVDVGNQILAGGRLALSGGHISAPVLISGVDFAATNASSGGIMLGQTGDMELSASAGVTNQTLLSAGSLNVDAADISATSVIAHKDIALVGGNSVKITGQLLGAGRILLSGQAVQSNQTVTGVDFAATARSLNGAIVVGPSGDLTIQAGSAATGSLIVAGALDVEANAFTASNITGYGAVSIDAAAPATGSGRVEINGQLLGAGNVSITGGSIDGSVIVAGVDFAATSQSSSGIVLGQAGNVSLTATAGDISANNLLAAGNISATAVGNVSAKAVAHRDIVLNAGNAITLSGQSLAAGNVNLTARSITIDTLVSGVDFAATQVSVNGSLMLQRAGAATLSASDGGINANALLSGGSLAANATQNIAYSSLQSLGDATLTAPGAITYTNTTRVGGNLTINTGAVDLSGTRGNKIAGGGTLTLNASSANFANSSLVFGGLVLNLSGTADFSGAHVNTVTNAGGSGDINISAAGLTANASTALLAAHDLALILPSFTNAGQLAAGNNLLLRTTSDLKNTSSGLIFASRNIDLFVGGVLANDQGAIVSSGDLTIQGAVSGQRNGAVINTSGLIQSDGSASILTSNLTNQRSTAPTWVTGQLISSGAVVGTFVLNPDIAGQPFAYLETVDQNMFQLYPGVNPPSWQEYQPQLWSVSTLADGTSYRAWTWISGKGPTEVRPIFNWIKDRVPKDANGNPVLDPNNPSRYFIVDEVVKNGSDTSTTYSWDWGANISQSIYEDRFTSPLSPEGVIRAGGNLTIDATNLNNSYSSIEAGGNASLKGGTLNNQGVALYRTTMLTCNAQSTCSAYNADGSANPSRDIANGTSIVSNTQVIASAAGNIKARGALNLAFGAINNSAAPGSVSGSASLAARSDPGNPLSALGSMTAGGALFSVNAALAGIAANGGANVGNGPSVTGNSLMLGSGPAIVDSGLAATGNLSVKNAGVTAGGGVAISGSGLTADGVASVSASGLTATGSATANGSSLATTGVAIAGSGPIADTGASLNGGNLTAAAGASVDSNSLIGKLSVALGGSGNLAEILRVNGAELASLAKPQSGGVGGTVPGQVFLLETRAAFLDVSKFYGSGYFIDRVGYTLETKVPFLGDAYFDNQLVDTQLRQLVGNGLGAGSFIPGDNATDQMKSLLDNGVAYAEANGLALGQALTPEQVANLTQSIVIYQTETINGAQVLVPVVYLSAADRAKLNGAGAIIAGSTVNIDAGNLNNSGAIAAADGMTIDATTIQANGGTFLAGGNLNLSASNGITLAAQTMTIGGQSVVASSGGITAGGGLKVDAGGGNLSLTGSKIAAGGAAQLSGQTITLATTKVDNGGQQNATGTRIETGGNLTIDANQGVDIIGSSAKAGGGLSITAKQGSVTVVSTDLTRQTDDGYTRKSGTEQQGSQLMAGGNLVVTANDGLLISGSDLKASGSLGLTANGDINVVTSQGQETSVSGHSSSSSLAHGGSTITAGGDIVAKSGNDINFIGSTMVADGTLGLQAKGDITIAEATDAYTLDVKGSTKKSGFFGSKKETVSGHLENTTAVGSSISGKDGATIVSGGDTTISASKVTAGDDTHVADLNVQTGGNLIVSAGKDTETENDKSKSKGFLRSGSYSYDGYNETTVGSQLSASGDVNLDAGKAAAIVGSKINADGSLNVSGESVSVIGAQENHQSDSQRKDSGLFVGSGGGFISLYGKNEKQGQQSSTDNIGSELSAGKDVNLTARATDLNIMGSSVSADRDINLSAARDVNVTPGAESSSQSEQQKKSGFGLALSAGNGGFSIGIGAQSTKDSKAQQSDTNAVSELSAGRDLNISAGNNVNLQATSASAERDVNLFAGKDINLLSANDVTNYEEVHEKTFAGVTISVTSQIGKAAQSIMNSAERLSDSGGVNAITNTAIAGLGFYEGYKGLKGAYEGLTSTDPKVGTGLSFSIGINAGVSHQENSWSSSSSTPVVTDIRAGRSITMEAEKGSITSDGAQILAGYDKNGIPTISGDPLTGDIFLSATNGDVNLNAATGTSDSTSSNKSWSAGVGVNFGCTTKGGCAQTGVGVNASYGKGDSETSGTSHTNTHVNGTGDVTIVTNDLALKGATVAGNSVGIDARSLTIESQLDTQKAKADQLNVSGQIGIGSFNVSGVTQKAKGDAVLVSEQSGIHAGTGGLDIDISGQTSLVGGLITSEAGAEHNSFSTGTLTVADIDTHSTWKAETYGGGIGTGGLTIAPPVKAGEKETGKAYSAIGGNIGITITDPAHQVQDISTIRRDTDNTNTSLPGLPDLQNILRDQYKTQADLQAAQATMAGLVADIANNLMLNATTQAEKDFWGEGGAGRAALHALGGGLLGGVNGVEGAVKGALGGAASTMLAHAVKELVAGMLKDAKLGSDEDRAKLGAVFGATIMAGIGSVVGGGEGAAYGAANYQYNYLADEDLFKAADALAAAEKCETDCAALWEKVNDYKQLSQYNDAVLITTCTAAPASSACQQMKQDLLKFASRLDRAGIDVFLDTAPSENPIDLTFDTATLQQFSGTKSAINLDVILARYLSEADKNGVPVDVAINKALTQISRTEGGMKALLDGAGVVGGVAACAGTVGTACALGLIGAAVSANQLVASAQQSLTGEDAKTALVYSLEKAGYSQEEAERYEHYMDIGAVVLTVGVVGGEVAVRFTAANLSTIASAAERQAVAQALEKIPPLRTINGKALNPKLPDPAAGYGYVPKTVASDKPNIANSHINGFNAEIDLANQIADLPGQQVLRYGDAVGTHGADVISVDVNTGDVFLWDSKFRNSVVSIKSSPTFTPGSNSLNNALQQAEQEIRKSTLPQSIKDKATANLDAGEFTANTVGTASAKNSVPVKYCGFNPC
nr:hemagglutinin repeat-containing protein [Rhizobium sp. BK602]